MKRTLSFFFAAIVGLAAFSAHAGDYDAYAQAVQAQAQASADAETARTTAIADIAASGSDAVKIVSIMALQNGQAAAPVRAGAGVAPPQDKLLAWGQLLIPAITQGYGAYLSHGTQRIGIAAQTEQYGTMMSTIGGVAQSGMAHAAKDPVIVHGAGTYVTQGGNTTPAPGSY